MIDRYSSRAVIINSKNQVLLYEFIQNNIKGSKAWWVFPGGKIEKNETKEDACIRELKEEVGLSITKPLNLIWERHIELNGKKDVIMSHEYYYLIKTDIQEVKLDSLTKNEKRTFLNYKWRSLEELKYNIGNLTISNTYELIYDIVNGVDKEYPIKIKV